MIPRPKVVDRETDHDPSCCVARRARVLFTPPEFKDHRGWTGGIRAVGFTREL